MAYWWEHDRVQTASSFRRALRIAPAGQTHFWYGNILADNGEHQAARREFDLARLAEPGSVAIETDLAWAEWSAGRAEAATRRLAAVIARNPDFAVAQDCLSAMRLAAGDYAGYLAALRARQRARAEPGLDLQVRAYDRLLAQGGLPALQRAMLEHAMRDEAGAPFPDHAWAAFVASTAGDRGHLLAILRLAERQGQKWGSSGYVTRIADRWRGDPEVRSLLLRRAPPPIESAA